MTAAELERLVEARDRAWRAMDSCGDARGLRAMPGGRRREVEEAARAYRDADRAVLEELLAREAPARAGEVLLWLTKDRLNWAAVDPATYLPAMVSTHRWDSGYASLLHAYPGHRPGRPAPAPAPGPEARP
jgi:hypothetical protein